MIYSLIPDLEKHPLFKDVPVTHTDKYIDAKTASVKEFPPNTVAYSSQTENMQVAFIISGAARVYMGNSEESALTRTLNAGDMFGIANLYDEDEPFPSYIITATDVKILFIDGKSFRAFIENDSSAMKNYITLLSKKIVYLNRKLATLTAGSAEKKLASYILENSTDNVFCPASSLSELANILQMGRASLYRAIDDLANLRLIEKQGKKIIILDKQKLKNI